MHRGRRGPDDEESVDMLSTTRYVVRSPAVVHEVIDGEAVIINLESGAYFSADGAGAVAWQRIAGGASPADLALTLAERYDGGADAIGEAVTRFVDSLRREGLIRPAEPGDDLPVPSPVAQPPLTGPGPVGQPSAAARPGLNGLELRIFTDLQELLLLDPIHDVDEIGWPAPLSRR
jgi:hypothetical protein